MKKNIIQLFISLTLLNLLFFGNFIVAQKTASNFSNDSIKSNVKIKELDIGDDFSAQIYYKLDNIDEKWNKRGNIEFISRKNSKNNKSSIKITNEIFNSDVFDRIRKECELKGLYLIRINIGGALLYSSMKACDLVRNNFKDKFIFNNFGSISPQNIVSVNYEENYLSNQKGLNKENFTTIVEFMVNEINSGIVTTLEAEEKKQIDQQQQEQPGFFSKYWYVIIIVIYVMSRSGSQEEGQEGAQQQSAE